MTLIYGYAMRVEPIDSFSHSVHLVQASTIMVHAHGAHHIRANRNANTSTHNNASNPPSGRNEHTLNPVFHLSSLRARVKFPGSSADDFQVYSKVASLTLASPGG